MGPSLLPAAKLIGRFQTQQVPVSPLPADLATGLLRGDADGVRGTCLLPEEKMVLVVSGGDG